MKKKKCNVKKVVLIASLTVIAASAAYVAVKLYTDEDFREEAAGVKDKITDKIDSLELKNKLGEKLSKLEELEIKEKIADKLDELELREKIGDKLEKLELAKKLEKCEKKLAKKLGRI